MRRQLLIDATIGDTIIKYAENAAEAGLDGVVCSPLEAGIVKEACGRDFLTVTPGIRFADAAADDQVRITTPARAREIGSDHCRRRSCRSLSPLRGGFHGRIMTNNF
jgi:orotidine-5'-phosphate decarboxylase